MSWQIPEGTSTELRRVPSEMKSALVFFLLLCGTAGRYVYISTSMDWFSAQSFCREHYLDLATIGDDVENKELIGDLVKEISAGPWIGLNRTARGSNTWRWSDGEPAHFFKWLPGQPDNMNGVESCAMVISSGWNDANCADLRPFFCSGGFVLVKDKKTWDEAFDYCRSNHKTLASSVYVADLFQPFQPNQEFQAETVSVWTGLHFVNGQWLCVNQENPDHKISLPSCPAPRYRCGAHNTEAHRWENRDCREKLNFLCYSWWVPRVRYSSSKSASKHACVGAVVPRTLSPPQNLVTYSFS